MTTFTGTPTVSPSVVTSGTVIAVSLGTVKATTTTPITRKLNVVAVEDATASTSTFTLNLSGTTTSHPNVKIKSVTLDGVPGTVSLDGLTGSATAL